METALTTFGDALHVGNQSQLNQDARIIKGERGDVNNLRIEETPPRNAHRQDVRRRGEREMASGGPYDIAPQWGMRETVHAKDFTSRNITRKGYTQHGLPSAESLIGNKIGDPPRG